MRRSPHPPMNEYVFIARMIAVAVVWMVLVVVMVRGELEATPANHCPTGHVCPVK